MGIGVNMDDKTMGIVMELMQASLMDIIYGPSFARASLCRCPSISALLLCLLLLLLLPLLLLMN